MNRLTGGSGGTPAESEANAVLRAPALAAGQEFDLIRAFLGDLPEPDAARVRLGPGDDCAVLGGGGITLSMDMSVEGVHFRREWLSPRQIGYRATAAALSDLAAMAAQAYGVLVSLALPERDAPETAAELMAGVREVCDGAGAALLGGDVTRSPGPLVVDVTVVGQTSHPVLRSGARRGDEVWVTGELGGAAAALHFLLRDEEPPPASFRCFARPAPRIHEARWLHARGVLHSMLDISDGLAGDAAHLAAASKVAVLLSPELIPVHPDVTEFAESREEALRLALGGGEDYELCFTAAPGSVQEHAWKFQQQWGLSLACVGRVAGGDGVWWSDAEGNRTPLPVGGYQHFRSRR